MKKRRCSSYRSFGGGGRDRKEGTRISSRSLLPQFPLIPEVGQAIALAAAGIPRPRPTAAEFGSPVSCIGGHSERSLAGAAQALQVLRVDLDPVVTLRLFPVTRA
ncbi:hypothetical protein STEG23_032731 [Scotinomys teguina]